MLFQGSSHKRDEGTVPQSRVHPFTARDLMGHQEIDMTGYYIHTADDTMREALNRIVIT